jgi:hypothetical protein
MVPFDEWLRERGHGSFCYGGQAPLNSRIDRLKRSGRSPRDIKALQALWREWLDSYQPHDEPKQGSLFPEDAA